MAASVSDEFQRLYVRPSAGWTLVVGSKVFPGRVDRRQKFAKAIGLDMQEGEGVDVIHNLEHPMVGRKFAHIDCVSVLEHCRRPWLVAENIVGFMAQGSTLFVSVPFVWRFHSYPSDFWRFTAEGVKALFPRIRWDRMMYGHSELAEVTERLPLTKVDGYPMIARTEILAFGTLD